MPLISVIVPVYNVEKYIHRCVDSILNQTFSDFELILIDDGSPDQCGQICDDYAKKDSRVTVIHHGENRGLSAARNSGINRAMRNRSSEWLTFIDSDDWVSPVYLEALLKAAKGHDVSVVSMQRVKGDHCPVHKDLSSTMKNTEEFFIKQYSNAVVVWGKLYRKKLFRFIRFPVGKIYEDTYTTHKILFQFPELPVTNKPLYYYFYNPDSIIHREWTTARLEEVYATAKQIAFFIKKGFPGIAETRFLFLRDVSTKSIERIKECPDLSDSEKKKYISKVMRAQKITLFRCRKYEWCSDWEHE